MSAKKFLLKMAREIIAFIVKCSGIPFFIREIYARNKVGILLYHSPSPDVLDKHLDYLSKRYRFISLDTLVDAIYSKDWSNIPEKALVITLDDGRKGNFKLLEIFKKYHVKPTIYLCTQLVGNNRHFQEGFSSEQNEQFLNDDELAGMNDFVDFQSHTQSHLKLPVCPFGQCEREIRESKIEVEIITGNTCIHFAYPSGYYTKREIDFVKKAGYRSSRTIDVGWNTEDTDPYKLRILGISDDAPLNWLVAQMSGIIMYVRYFFRGKYKQIKAGREAG